MGRARAPRGRQGARGDVRDIVLFLAQRKLLEHDGRAAGIKFNKLVFSIYNEFSGASNPELRFDLPYRWYLYGAVIDTGELGGIIAFDHQDEMRSNVIWTGPPPNLDSAAVPEIERLCDAFCSRFPGDLYYGDMLREHYRAAREPFQNAFLEWNLLVGDMIHGSRDISVKELKGHLAALGRDYPDGLEPRLTPSFRRLSLCLDDILSRATVLRFEEVKVMEALMWEFWATFCLFLSLRYNHAISKPRLDSYRERAERELVAYKRRLGAALETRYLDSRAGEGIDEASMKELASILEPRVLRLMGRTGSSQ